MSEPPAPVGAHPAEMAHPGEATTAHARSLLLRWRSDRHLVALVRRGDQEACQALVDRHRDRLVELSRQVTGSDEDPSAVVGDIVAAAYAAMAGTPAPVSPRPWLYRITRDRALARARSSTTLATADRATRSPDAPAAPHRAGHGRAAGRQVLEDVGGLPEAQRTALFLRGTERLSYEDAAEAMGTTVRAVQEHLVRARMALARTAVERGGEHRAPATRTHRWRRAGDARGSVTPTQGGD